MIRAKKGQGILKTETPAPLAGFWGLSKLIALTKLILMSYVSGLNRNAVETEKLSVGGHRY